MVLIEWDIEIYITPLNETEREKGEKEFLYDCGRGLRLATKFPVVTCWQCHIQSPLGFSDWEQDNLLYCSDHQLFLDQWLPVITCFSLHPSVHPSIPPPSMSLSLPLPPWSYYPNWLLWSKEEVCREQGRLLWTPHQHHSTALHFEIIGSPCFWSLCKRTLLFTRWLCT